MALAGLVRKAVALAHKQSKSVQVTVMHRQWISADGFGNITYASGSTGIPRLAMAEQKLQFKNKGDGQLIAVKAVLTFLKPIPDAPGAVAGRQDPIDPKDELVLPDGDTGPIVFISGMTDPKTSRPFMIEVWVGAR